MDLGLGFDDTDFETKQKQRAGPLTSYNAKICSPLWFESEGADADPDWLAQRLKFSGDHHYHAESYKMAASKYNQLLGLIHENNTSMRQDVEESLCRCYMKLNQYTESLRLARKLVEMMKTEDEAKQRQTLILYSQVCRCAGDWKGCIWALEQLADQQNHYAQFWLQLGQAYLQHELVQADQKRDAENSKQLSNYSLACIVACFIRARLLLESVQNTVGGLARERNEQLIQKIAEEVGQLEVSQDLTDQARQAMKTDIERSPADSTGQGGDDVDSQPGADGDCNKLHEKQTSYSSEGFAKRWFLWAEKYLEDT